MHKFTTLLLLFLGFAATAQIKGKITTTTGEGIPFVSITIENTYTSTTANEEGRYELPVKTTGKYTIVFQSIGFKAKKATVNITSLPHTLDLVMEDESYLLEGVTISSGAEDPAYAIIRKAIAARKANAEKAGRFEADFYSKGSYRVKNLPKKFMGMKLEVEDQGLDSTGSGMIYLAESVSRITYEYPGNIKERVIASKVSGDSNGFDFNNARENNFDFYEDYVQFEIKMVSPIAKGALGYYKYKFDGSFYDDDGHLVNKIQVIPRRDKEPVFEGHIYIVGDTWAIYATDLNVKGYRMQMPVISLLNIKQNYSYNSNNNIWAKNSQTLDFTAGMFGITFMGKFTHVYSNYEFRTQAYPKETFGREIAIIEKDYNKKDSVYWNAMRPVPLLEDELADYKKKDSIQAAKKEQKNAVLTNKNRFKVLNIIDGYTYQKQDSLGSLGFKYNGVLEDPSYNTVQGWSLNSGLSFNFNNRKTKRYFSAWAKFNYGIAEDRLRVHGSFSRHIKKVGTFTFTGGNTIEQFNPDKPISPFINSISTLIFKDNYMKLYDNAFARVSYGRNVSKYLMVGTSVEYLRRRPLFNNADWVFIKNDHEYTSNNPLEPYNYTSAPFRPHNIVKGVITGNVVFERDYVTYPSGKMYMWGQNLPEISFRYEKAFGGSVEQYEYNFISAKAKYQFSIDNKGDFGASLSAGKFFGADGIAFMDYKHFKGNQTHVGTDAAYLDVFNLLPYYALSTNDAYVETHVEHNFKGYIMNKIPLLNLLQWNLIVGYHNLMSPDYKPYHEVSVGFNNIGIGAFRFLRVDYVRSYQGGFVTDGVVFGLNFFM